MTNCDATALNIFPQKTTYQDSYQKFAPQRHKLRPEESLSELKPVPIPPHKVRDHETLLYRRETPYIPFSLLHQPGDIIGTNPYAPFQPPLVPVDCEKTNVIKTRPRVYMSPAICLDDVQDPNTRDILVKNTYTTETSKAVMESKVKASPREVPNTTVEPQANPVQFKLDLLEPLPRKYRGNVAKDWENAQKHLMVDPTRRFWENNDSVRCGACFDSTEGLVPASTKSQIRHLIAKNQLRLPHDSPIPGYAGYKPRFSGGIPLEKVELPVEHPLLTVSQAITKRWENRNKT